MKVIGMGNALVDVLTLVHDDEVLTHLDLPKGSMQLVDSDTSRMIHHHTQDMPRSKAAGGSAANTINGLAKLGIETAFIGHIGNDDTGQFFRKDMEENGIRPHLFSSNTPSGIANALISPDGERTFATYLGAALELSAEHLDTSLFSGYDYFYVEGYMVQNEMLLKKAFELARQQGLQIVLDLASFNVVEANKRLLSEVLSESVDIVFANEEEARAYTGKNPEEALEILASICRIAIVKTGAQGSLIQSGSEKVKVDAIPAKAIDTTGAGDLFASGFLYGLLHNMDLGRAGKAGSLLAGNVVEVIGPKMDIDRWDQIRSSLQTI
ncbi:MAG: adenosine kinase [Bacteroidales bacterium]|nr:adenosine kinase [Bacteroidales bacterium]